MPHFSPSYIEKAIASLIRHSTPVGSKFNDLRKRENPLYILNVDVKNSTSIPPELRRPIIHNLRLHFATEIVSRNGWLSRVTDGADAFFVKLPTALTTALAIYHRKRQIQENIIRPLITAHYSSRRDTERRLDYRDVDYRIVVLRFPPNQKNVCTDPNSDGDPLDKISERWYEASSRYGNKELFLISHSVLNDLRNLNDKSEELFQNGMAVPFTPTKPCDGSIADFFGAQLWNYANPAFQDFKSSVTIDAQNRADGQALDAHYRIAFTDRRADYNSWKRHRADKAFSFEPYRIEHGRGPRSLPGAIVIGDVNLDLVTYINDEDVPALGRGHVQLQQDIEKVVAGKGMNIARALEESGKFNPIVLIAKLGMDREMGYIVQDLKSHPYVKPLFMLSTTLPTGTSVVLRRQGQNSSLLTISDKPNANSDLRAEEVAHYHVDLLKNDYLFISGYCLLDDRIEIVERLLAEMKKLPGKRAVLEFSPARLLWSRFSESEERKHKLKSIVQSCFVVAFEDGAFGDRQTEQEMLDRVPYAIRISSEFDALAVRRSQTGHWSTTSIPVDPGKSLGLFSKQVAEFVSKEFLKPRIALCSKSPRRYELLTSIYGHSSVYHHSSAAGNGAENQEFSLHEFDDETSLRVELVRVSAEKARAGIDQLSEMWSHADQIKKTDLDSCVVAIASDLVVSAREGDKYIAVEKPELSPDHVGQVRKIFTKYYSGKQHTVVTCTCFVELKPFSDGLWNKIDVDLFCREFEGFIAKLRALPPKELQRPMGEWNSKFGLSTVWFHVNSSVVTFDELSDAEVEEYAASGEWRNKGGGYAIQGNAAYFVSEIQGSVTNIVGLPMEHVDRILKKHFSVSPDGM